MHTEDYIVDLHCHPNLKAFNSGHPKPVFTLWDKIIHPYTDSSFMRWVRRNSANVHKESQCDLTALAENQVRVINLSLYPMERGFLHLRNVPKFLVGGNRTEMMLEHISGMALKRITALRKQDNHYFANLEAEYEYVRNGQGKCPDRDFSYEIVNNYRELQAALKKPGNIAVIISIEGAHSFGSGTPVSLKMKEAELKEVMTDNLRKVKQWEYPPFTVNLAHHFWNQLCGHSSSFRRPISDLINQNKGKDKGFTDLGRHIMRELLSRENGKRILIDTKHMSVASRREYYDFLINYNYLNPNDKIPIICSHGGVNGYKDMAASMLEKDNLKKSRNSLFHRWSINVSDEEIRIIHDSEGLIGFMMDKGMVGGGNHVKQIVTRLDLEQQRIEFCKLFWQNIFHAVKAVNKPTGWDIMALGTDYDGTISHMDPYEGAAKLPTFWNDLVHYLEETKLHKELWYDYQPKELVKKLMYTNSMEFYRKYFI